jgi:hypothetical protein
MQKVFTAATRDAANLEADQWWGQQQGLRQVHRTQVAVGWGPSLADADQWRVTIHYEPETPN